MACGRTFTKTVKGKGFLASDKKVKVTCGRPKGHDGACSGGPSDEDLLGQRGFLDRLFS